MDQVLILRFPQLTLAAIEELTYSEIAVYFSALKMQAKAEKEAAGDTFIDVTNDDMFGSEQAAAYNKLTPLQKLQLEQRLK